MSRFYVKTPTKKSQWEKPTEPAKAPDDDLPPGPPPSYTPGKNPTPASDTKSNPYDGGKAGSAAAASEDDDAKLARQL